jgi:hypothetical protein
VVSELAARQPAVVTAWADSGDKRSVIETGAVHGIEVQVVSKEPVRCQESRRRSTTASASCSSSDSGGDRTLM